MKNIVSKILFSLTTLFILNQFCFADENEQILKAMRDEIHRSLSSLSISGLQKPYYIEYKLIVRNSFEIKSVYGSLVESSNNKHAILTVGVRVGNYKLDNTNYFDFGLSFFGSGDDEERFKSRTIPVELDYPALRRELWLATDAAYKQVTETYTKKETTLKNRVIKDTTWDFTQIPPEKNYFDSKAPGFDKPYFEDLSKKLSAIFGSYPDINTSSVGIEYLPETDYYVNSEGMEYTKNDFYAGIEIVAATQSSDGMPYVDYFTAFARDPKNFPVVDSLMKATKGVAENLSNLTKAQILDESYSGPILFTGQASAQLFAQQFAPNLVTQREPLTEQGKQDNDRFTAYQNKIGGRVLPEFLSIVDEPLKTKYEKSELIGNFILDDEGVKPEEVNLVNAGYLKNLLSTRIPTKRVRKTNGHQRGGAAMWGILEMNSDKSHSKSFEDLKEQMIKLCKDRELPFGIIVTKLIDQNILFTTLFRITAGTYPIGQIQTNIPIIEAYKIYQDGRIELIRGCEVRGINAQSFKDVLNVGKEKYALNLLSSPVVSPFMSGGSQYITASVIVPSLLFEDGEIKPLENDFPKPPIMKSPVSVK